LSRGEKGQPKASLNGEWVRIPREDAHKPRNFFKKVVKNPLTNLKTYDIIITETNKQTFSKERRYLL